jgi:hypothetical protein
MWGFGDAKTIEGDLSVSDFIRTINAFYLKGGYSLF